MSARHISVGKVIEELQKYPKDMLVVGYGIDGWCKGEKLDGVKVYKHVMDEGGDGFIPMDEDILTRHDWKQVRDKHSIGFGVECVVISPIAKDNLRNWCELKD